MTAAAAPSVPDGTRVYAVGDVHGRCDLLEELLERVAADAAGPFPRKVAVYLGDYVDRGARSRDVIDLLLADPLPGFLSVHLRGNHEDMMQRFLADPGEAAVWLYNGGDATLMSYGVRQVSAAAGDPLKALHEEFLRRLPPAHRAFLDTLEPFHREGDYIFAHAGVRPGVALAEQSLHDLLWIRGPFLNSTAQHGGVVVHGHSIVAEPVERENRIAIDTGAFFSGRLTCLVLEGAGRRYLHTGD